MTEMQKQFEEWFKRSHTENVQKVDGEYVHGATERLWQASRAAIVVKLPDWFVNGIDAAVYRDDVIKALSDAGVDYED